MNKTPFFQAKKQYLPQFSRLFTARLLFWVAPGLFCGILASFLFFGNHTQTVFALPNPKQSLSNGELLQARQSYDMWKKEVETRPEYRDGYVMLAFYAQKLGKLDEAASYVQKAVSLDPTYTVPEILQMEIEE